jgi:hypothetical protein
VRRSTKQQLAIGALLIAAAVVGAIAAPYVHPSTTPPLAPSPSSTVSTASAAEALQDLRTLPVSDAYVPGYERATFGQAWADTDHNGCDTRNDVLRRDLVDVVTKPGTHGCVVLSGTLHDPYTGRTIAFHRGNTSSLAVQIDHRIPLAYAWQHGAASWTAAQRELFANDQATNLVAVDGPANEEKSDSGPAKWMPPSADDGCAYAASFVAVATKWHLSIGSADNRALGRTLTTCR